MEENLSQISIPDPVAPPQIPVTGRTAGDFNSSHSLRKQEHLSIANCLASLNQLKDGLFIAEKKV